MSIRKLIVCAVTLAAFAAVFAFVDLHEIWAAISRTDPVTLVFAGLLIVANNLLALLRFASVLRAMNFRPAWRELIFAFSIGQVSSQFVLSVVGQSISRAVALAQCGVPFGASIAATYVERLLAAGILFVLSVSGLLFLFNRFEFEITKGGAYFLTSMIAMTVIALVAGFVVLRSAGSAQTLGKSLAWIRRIWPSAIITLVVHAAMLAAYAVVLTDYDYRGVPIELAAALTIVMFTASLPISFAGWGVRELSAATALSAIGCPPAIAIAAGIVIGALSFVVMVALAFIGIMITKQRFRNLATSPATPQPDSPGVHWDKLLLDGCALFCLIFVFFQIRIPVGSSQLTMNVADIGAITGLGMVILLLATRRMRMPIPAPLVTVLGIVSAVFVFGIAVAYFNGILGNWALINRGFGWIVIVGYVTTMAAFINLGGHSAWILALRTFVAVGMTVCLWQLALLGFSLGIHRLSYDVLPIPLEGFVGNQNAFVLQLAMLMIATTVLFRQDDRRWATWFFYVSTGILTATFYYAKSRTGLIYLGTAAILLFWLSTTTYFAALAKPLRKSILVLGSVTFVAICLPYAIYAIYTAASEIINMLNSVFGISIAVTKPNLDLMLSVLTSADQLGLRVTHAASDSERLKTITDGLALWREHPLIGGGLGAFAEWRIATGQGFNVIHSTPVWILAEMGITGLLAVGAVTVLLLLMAWRYTRNPATAAEGFTLIWILVFTAIGAIVHDFFFQRIFWLMLGLTCAIRYTADRGPHVAR